MRRFVRENSLSLVLVALCAVFVVLQSVTGLCESNDDRSAHGETAATGLPETGNPF